MKTLESSWVRVVVLAGAGLLLASAEDSTDIFTQRTHAAQQAEQPSNDSAAITPAAAEQHMPRHWDQAASMSELVRVPWTESRVTGAPDPPPPFVTENAYPQLTFNHPLYVSRVPESPWILVVEQAGSIVSFVDEATTQEKHAFCTLPDHDTYGLTFHPHFADNRQVFVFANGPNSAQSKFNRIYRYQVTQSDPPRCVEDSRTLIVEWSSNGHNGGDLAFGPDGMLYITSGDGTTDSDTNNTGQDISDLTSGLLRIDVNDPLPGQQYRVPADNPFVNVPNAKPELWAFGFRNPWRMAIHPRSGEILVGDIGQDIWEMIQRVERGSNHGWSIQEGSHPFYPNRTPGPGPLAAPLIEHHHSEARSITGGVFYAGQDYPQISGAYIYGDYATGRVWAVQLSNSKVVSKTEIADTALQLLGFGADTRGELLMVDYLGTVHRLKPQTAVANADFPRLLSQTGIFLDTPRQHAHPGVVSYSVVAPLWSDGAQKDRWIGLPPGAQAVLNDRSTWELPDGTVLVKTFSLPLAKAGAPRCADLNPQMAHVETRILVRQQGEWAGYSYRWKEDQSDAMLIGTSGEDLELSVASGEDPNTVQKQVWHFPSRAECMVCHSRAAGFVLGIQSRQLQREHDYGNFSGSQIDAWQQLGLYRLPEPPKDPPAPVDPPPKPPVPLVDPADASQPIEARVRSYLHVNCAICHVEAGGGNSAINLHVDTDLQNMRLLGVSPLHDRFSIADGLLLAPGKPEQSVLLHRITKRGRGQMPPLGSNLVDPQAEALIHEWIQFLGDASRQESQGN